jgi:hypothetical protein
LVFENAIPYRSDRVSLRELLVRRAEAPDSDTESLAGSQDSDDDDDDPIFSAQMHRTSTAAAQVGFDALQDSISRQRKLE